MRAPLWNQILTAARFVDGAAKVLAALWFVLFMVGVLNASHLLTMVMATAGLYLMVEYGVRQEVGWVLLGAAILLQITLIEGIGGGIVAGLGLGYAAASVTVMYQRGTLRPKSVVRMHGWRALDIDRITEPGSFRAEGDLRRGSIACTFRSLVIDLRQAHIERRPAIIDVSCFVGRVEIQVPEDWVIHERVHSLLNRVRAEIQQAPASIHGHGQPLSRPVDRTGIKDLVDADPGLPHLLIQGSVFLGALTITRQPPAYASFQTRRWSSE